MKRVASTSSSKPLLFGATKRRSQQFSTTSTLSSSLSLSYRFSSSFENGNDQPLPQRQQQQQQKKSTTAVAFAEKDDEASASSSGLQQPSASSTLAPTDSNKFASSVVMSEEMKAMTKELDEFFDEKERQMSHYVKAQNQQNVKLPPRPEELIPTFQRVKRSAKLLIRFNDPDDIVHEQKWNYVQLPPMKEHPWVPYTKHGKHMVHGDGMLNVVGTGEVGFDAAFNEKTLPKTWRGLQKKSNVGERLPLRNGSTLQDAVVKYSLQLTGKGIFATRDIKKGELIMIVDSTAQNVGFNDEQSRLIEMTADILKNTLKGTEEDKHFLHHWVLTGQLSSIAERWRRDATDKIIELIGGEEQLAKLELHRENIPRIAAIIHMNSFLVESQYAERRGTAYWPEAALLNHSCEPNTTYEIVPEQMFTTSEFYVGTSDQELMTFESENINLALQREAAQQQQQQQIGTSSSAAAAAADGGRESASSSDSSSSHDSSTNKNSSGGGGGCGDPNCTDCHDTTHGRSSTSSSSSSSSSSHLPATTNSANKDDGVLANPNFADLTPRGANTFLFCARASKDIAAGEEILISYVPTEWPFYHRQEVLLERYKFRCKCPRCSPDIDANQQFMTKFLIPVFLVSLLLKIMLSFALKDKEEDDEVDLLKWKRSNEAMPAGIGEVGRTNASDPFTKGTL